MAISGKQETNRNFNTELIGNNLKITLLNLSLAVDSNLSFIINNGQILNSIQVVDQNNSTIAYSEANWIGNSKIIYLKPENLIGINEIKNKNINTDEGFKFSTFPNPFSNSLEFEVTLKTSSNVSLNLYTISGVFISKLVDGLLQDGAYKKTYDSSLLAEGIYFYELRVNEKTESFQLQILCSHLEQDVVIKQGRRLITQTDLEKPADLLENYYVLRIGEIPDEDGSSRSASRGGKSVEPPPNRLGLVLSVPTAEQKRALGIQHGLIVDEVKSGGARSELRAGDVILSAIVKGSQVEVKSPAQFNDLLQGLEKTGSMTLLVRRGDAQTFITIKGASDK